MNMADLMRILAVSWLLLSGLVAMAQTSHIQFFGDTYLPRHIVRNDLSREPEQAFIHVKTLFQQAEKNIVNLEGALTRSRLPRDVTKMHLLRMDGNIAKTLKNVGIHAVSLANNHTLDFGTAGLFDTLSSLASAGISGFGAGMDQEHAERPLILDTSAGPVCLLAFSLTLPENHWAGPEQAGTAHGSFAHIKNKVASCATKYPFTFAVFHWGAENHTKPKPYQSLLARKVIDAGASGVIGHHPHVLQPLEFYKGRPILYSIGNFTFGTRPFHSTPEGAAVRFHLNKKRPSLDLIPLDVNNRHIVFRPRPFKQWTEVTNTLQNLPKNCEKRRDPIRWHCAFQL